MIKNLKKDYEVCNCHKITLQEIQDIIKINNLKTLGQLQEQIKVGTACRFCICPEGDFGKIKKHIYCIDILKEVRCG